MTQTSSRSTDRSTRSRPRRIGRPRALSAERSQCGSPLCRPRRGEDRAATRSEHPPRDRGGQQARRRGRSRLRRVDPAGAALRRAPLERAVDRDPPADRRADPEAGRHDQPGRGRVRSRARGDDPCRGRLTPSRPLHRRRRPAVVSPRRDRRSRCHRSRGGRADRRRLPLHRGRTRHDADAPRDLIPLRMPATGATA